MQDFIQFIDKVSPLNAVAKADLALHMKTRSVHKGDYLLKEGETCRKLFYIDSGLTKTFFSKEGKEFIMRLFSEGEMYTVLDSYIQQQPSTYMILALEPTDYSYIDHAAMEELCRKHHCIETFFRKLVSMASVRMMSRISEMLEEDGTDRYNNFVQTNSALLQRISLGDLASYLGITQVSLSRIRGRK